MLHKSEPTEKGHETQGDISTQVQRAVDRGVRVLGLVPQTDTPANYEVASFFCKREPDASSTPNAAFAAAAEKFLQNRNVEPAAPWRETHAQTLKDHRLFLDPQYAKIAEHLLQGQDGTPPLCIINVTRENQLFLECKLPKTTLEEWIVNWRGSALGNFATILLNAVEIRDKSHADAMKRLQTVVQTFEWLEDELIQQMCHVNVPGRVVARGTVESIQESPTVCSDPNWTFWHQLKRFFAHYTRDADAPMRWEDEGLRFWVPPILHPRVRYLLITSAALDGDHLRRTFSDTETEILAPEPRVWAHGNRIFQIRTGTYPRKTILDHSNTWDILGISETGQRIFSGIQAEIERDPNVKHGIITHIQTIGQLENIAKNENVRFLTSFRKIKGEGLETAFQAAEVIWIVGMPEARPRSISDRAQILFGNDAAPLSYEMEPESYRYKDDRVQSVYERTAAYIFTQIIELAQLHRVANKKIMLITGLRIPEITDRPETLLFDWEDFEVAGGLDKLPETIQTRQRYEKDRDNLTAESGRKKIEAVLGCSTRQANRVLQKLRGTKIVRPPLREQILSLLADGEKTTPELTEAIQGHPKAINTKLTRLVDTGEIIKVRRGVYRLPER